MEMFNVSERDEKIIPLCHILLMEQNILLKGNIQPKVKRFIDNEKFAISNMDYDVIQSTLLQQYKSTKKCYQKHFIRFVH